MFTIPAFSSVSFASYPKSFWESDLCKKGTPKAFESKKKKSQRTNNGIAGKGRHRVHYPGA
jgi:hypothetical protein